MSTKKFILLSVIFFVVPLNTKTGIRNVLGQAGDFAAHPIVTGGLFLSGLYISKKYHVPGTRAMCVATALNVVGVLNDFVYIKKKNDELSNKFASIKTTKQRREDDEIKNKKYPVFVLGQIAQAGSMLINVWQLYKLRNQYKSREFTFFAGNALLSLVRVIGCSQVYSG